MSVKKKAKRLPLSRPRPVRGPQEPEVSFALRWLTWVDEQERRGWTVNSLAVLSPDEFLCLEASRELLARVFGVGVDRLFPESAAAELEKPSAKG